MSLYDKSYRKNQALLAYKHQIKNAKNVTKINKSFNSTCGHLYQVGFEDGRTGYLSTTETTSVYWLGRSDGRRAWMRALLVSKEQKQGKVARFSGHRWQVCLDEMRLNRPLATKEEIEKCLADREFLDAKLSASRLSGVLSVLRSQT